MKRVGFCLAFFLGFAAAAQEPGERTISPEETFRDTQNLIDEMQRRIDQINDVSSARDREIEFLNKQINEAIQHIATQRKDKAALQQNNLVVREELTSLYTTQDALNAKLTEAARDRESVVADLRSQTTDLIDLLAAEQDLTALLREDIGKLAAELQSTEGEKERTQKDLSDARSAMVAAKEEMARRQDEIADLVGQLSVAEKTVQLGRAQIDSLRNRIAALDAALRASRKRTATQDAEMADLERQLNIALMKGVRGLSRYRSEFFGRLREALGERPDIRVVGDRFVFQSEVLFESGSTELDPGGVATLGRLAQTLREVASRIPRGLNWVLRVDGHTDRVPIRNIRYPSNWELSSARAISVVKFLIDEGLPADRLAATGFAEFQPLDTHDDEIAYRRNRRIEFKLTQR